MHTKSDYIQSQEKNQQRFERLFIGINYKSKTSKKNRCVQKKENTPETARKHLCEKRTKQDKIQSIDNIILIKATIKVKKKESDLLLFNKNWDFCEKTTLILVELRNAKK